ncbi:MAG: CAP domain-containing protein [Lachnospiraceae bacterium]|nr:CAP domain-containing protein [Lachnospiraceae bacterium]
MRRGIKMGMIILPVLLIFAFVCLSGCAGAGGKETFSDVQAYRTAIDLDLEYPDEADGSIAVDPPGTVNTEELRKEAMEALNIINNERTSNNLAPLKWDQKLELCAQIRAQEISYSFSNEHIRPNGRNWYTVAHDAVLGENIYKGKKTAEKALESWMKNPTDKKNFMCDYFTKMAVSIYEGDKGEYCWAALFGTDTIDVSFNDNVEPASVWILADTENNRHTSIWGTAMIRSEELGKEYNAGIPKADDDKYLFRMIDDDEMYYDAQISELKSGWKINLYTPENAMDPKLDVYDENGDIVEECSVFWAAL